MKLISKLTLALTALAALAFMTPAVQAQRIWAPDTLSYTNHVTNAATFTMDSKIIDVANMDAIMLLVTGSTVETTNGTAGFAFQGSVDRTNWTTEPDDALGIVLTLNSTNTVRAAKVINTTYWRYLRLWHITNGVDCAVTNITVTPFSKRTP